MESIKDKDIPVIQAFVLLISFTIVILNLLVDLCMHISIPVLH